MSKTLKTLDQLDYEQVIQSVYNGADASLTTAGFVVGMVGRKVERVDVSATVEDFKFYENASLLYTIRVTYTDSSKETLVSAERVA